VFIELLKNSIADFFTLILFAAKKIKRFFKKSLFYFQSPGAIFTAMRKFLKSFICIISFSAANAQEKDFGNWATLNLKGVANENWSAYTEFQLRSLSQLNKFYYYELKGGVTYSFLKNYSVTFGTGLYNTFNEGPAYDGYSKQKEFRTWQQFIAEQKLSIVEIEHRYRAEQRFTDSYSNRFRYRLNVSVPINKKEIIAKTFYASVYDEVFFTDKIPHFSRNRFYAGAGYVFNDKITLQTGWLRQIDYLNNRQRRKNYFYTSLSLTLKK
jgi:hypothetical protein